MYARRNRDARAEDFEELRRTTHRFDRCNLFLRIPNSKQSTERTSGSGPALTVPLTRLCPQCLRGPVLPAGDSWWSESFGKGMPMAAMKPRTGDGPLEVTKEGRGIVMRVPLEGGGRLVVELNAEEAKDLGDQLVSVVS